METRLSLNTVMVRDQDQVTRVATTMPMEKEMGLDLSLGLIVGMVMELVVVTEAVLVPAADCSQLVAVVMEMDLGMSFNR
jgi:hypothetical protein